MCATSVLVLELCSCTNEARIDGEHPLMFGIPQLRASAMHTLRIALDRSAQSHEVGVGSLVPAHPSRVRLCASVAPTLATSTSGAFLPIPACVLEPVSPLHRPSIGPVSDLPRMSRRTGASAAVHVPRCDLFAGRPACGVAAMRNKALAFPPSP